MLKLVGAVMVAFACGYFGFYISMSMRKRTTSIEKIITSLEMLEGEIGFGMNKLKQAFLNIDTCGIFSCVAEKIAKCGIKNAFESAVSEYADKLALKNEDKEILIVLGDKMGRTDVDDQIKSIKYVKALLEERKKSASEEYERLGKIYRNGGILVGLMIAVMLF